MEHQKKDEMLETKIEWFKFFSNLKCEYFPCHENADEENFNCLFCYCPLYALGGSCGGNFVYTMSGIKDCSSCQIPHSRDAFDYITSKRIELMNLAKLKQCK